MSQQTKPSEKYLSIKNKAKRMRHIYHHHKAKRMRHIHLVASATQQPPPMYTART